MPSGTAHLKINFAFLPVFLFLVITVGFVSLKLAFLYSIGFSFGTLWLDPDLDTHSNSFRRWGMFKFIWLPYQKMIPHRSIFSHGLLIGDALRLFYLMGWLVILFYVPPFIIWNFLEPICARYVEPMKLFGLLVASGMVFILFFSKARKRIERVIFFIILAGVAYAKHVYQIDELKWIAKQYTENFYSVCFFILGIILSSTIHTVADILYSGIKILKKKK